jgi:hypothetical protein
VHTKVEFTLDGAAEGYYEHEPSNREPLFEFGSPVFEISNLDNTPHTLVITVDGSQMVFDYATYT